MDKNVNQKCLISLIIPVYNVESYVEECVNSALTQDFTDYEIILVDDGSTDSSGQICDNLAECNIRVKSFHKKNGGLSSARNYGVEKANGRYIYFLDSDDYIRQGTLSSFDVIIRRNDFPDVVLENGQYYNNSGDLSKVVKFRGGEDFGKKNGRDSLNVLLHGEPLHAAFGKCFKTEFWNNNDFQFDIALTSEDLDLIYKVIYRAENVVMTDEPYYVYRENREGSIMNKFKEKNMLDLFRIFDGWEEFFSVNNCDNEIVDGMKHLLGNVYYDFVICKLGVVDSDNKEDLLKTAEKYIPYLHYTKRRYIVFLVNRFGMSYIVNNVRWIARYDALSVKVGRTFRLHKR